MSTSKDPHALLQQADKTLASGGGLFRSFFSSEDKYETAQQLYNEAALLFRRSDKFQDAARAYEKSAAVSEKHLDGVDTSSAITEAIKMYKEGKLFQDALRCLEMQHDRLQRNNSFDRASGMKDQMGDIYADLGDRKNAFLRYTEAAKEKQRAATTAMPHQTRKLVEKAAMQALLGNEFHQAIQTYEESIKILEDSAKGNQSHTLGFMKDEIELQIALCHLAVADFEGIARLPSIQRALQSNIGGGKHRFFKELYEAMELEDAEKFKRIQTDKPAESHILDHVARYFFSRGASLHPSASQYPSAGQMADDEDADMY